MKRLLIFIAIFTALLITPKSSEAVQGAAMWGYQCLNFTQCSAGGATNSNTACPPQGNDAVHVSNWWAHRAQVHLWQATFPANAEVYVAECLEIGVDRNGDGVADPFCTTGNSNIDKMINCGTSTAQQESCDVYTQLKNLKGYDLTNGTAGVFYEKNYKYVKVDGEKITTDAAGKTSVGVVEWEGITQENLRRSFLAYYFLPGQSQAVPTSLTPSTGPNGVGGQQQATLTFPSSAPRPSAPPPDTSSCKGQAWDPYGRVFDMKSLEPIPNAGVLLSMKNEKGEFDQRYTAEKNPFIFNPFMTGNAGDYLFFVTDGDYRLQPTVAGYSHPSSQSQGDLNPRAREVYSDIYYNDSPAILQRGSIQHRDIPMMPSDGVGKSYEIKIISESQEILANGKLQYTAVVSHPLSELVIEICKNENNIETCSNPTVYTSKNGGPDKEGNVSITLDQNGLGAGEYFGRSYRKIDFTKPQASSLFQKAIGRIFSLVISSVSAQEVSSSRAKLQPIVPYLEGYAYDKNGSLMPKAIVNLYVNLSERPIYQTQANEKGYYKITSEYIPKVAYVIGYSKDQTTPSDTKITTSQFLEENKDFLEAEKIDPYKIVTKETDPRKNIVPSFSPATQISAQPSTAAGGNPGNTNTNNETQNTPAAPKNIAFLVGAILLILVAAVGTLLAVYVYKKRSQEASN